MKRRSWRYGSAVLAVGAMLAAGAPPATAAPPDRDDFDIPYQCFPDDSSNLQCLSQTGRGQTVSGGDNTIRTERSRYTLTTDGAGGSVQDEGGTSYTLVTRDGADQLERNLFKRTVTDSAGNECRFANNVVVVKGEVVVNRATEPCS